MRSHLGVWKNYDPLNEPIRANIERGIVEWVDFLTDKGALHGELAYADELTDFILKQFEPDKEEGDKNGY